MTEDQRHASEVLFDLVAGLDHRIKPLKSWYFETVALLDKWQSAEKNRGVKRMKDILQYGWLLILGEKPEPLTFCKQSKSGCPTVVQPLVDHVKRYSLDARLMSGIYSLVRMTDLFQGQPTKSDVSDSLKTIDPKRPLPPSANAVVTEFQNDFLPQFMARWSSTPLVRAFRAPLRLDDSNTSFYRESKGVNGPITASAHKDIVTLSRAKCQNGATLLENVKLLEEEIIAQQSRSWKSSTSLSSLMMAWPGAQQLSVAEHPGKISIVTEKSAKVRLVAQPDYWSQLALTPIHRWLCNILRSIPSDCTYDQRGSIPKIIKWQLEHNGAGSYLASFDQSACTDLFPFDLQLTLLSHRFGGPLSEAVRTVMVDRDWEVRVPRVPNPKIVRWTRGQPMGLLASWPLMAFSHHMLVQYAYWISCGKTFGKSKSPFNRYVICGDDIVIADKDVANAYRGIVSRLGMKINISKSHVSGRGTGVEPVSEFAKILVWKGQPLFPIRPNMVLSAVKDWRNAIPLFIDLSNYSGWRVKRRFLESLIKDHFREGSRFLTHFITIPRELGGCGMRDSGSLKTKFSLAHTREIHPWLYYLGSRIRSSLREEVKLARLSPLNESAALPTDVIRNHPLTEFQASLGNEIRQIAQFFDQRVPTVPEICLDIVENGLRPCYTRFLVDDAQVSEVPVWEDDRTRERKFRKSLSNWEKAYGSGKPNAVFHSFPRNPRVPVVYHGVILEHTWYTGEGTLSDSTELATVSSTELTVVEEVLRLRRAKTEDPTKGSDSK